MPLPVIGQGHCFVDKVVLLVVSGWVARYGRNVGGCQQLGARRGTAKKFVPNDNDFAIAYYRFSSHAQDGLRL